MNSLTQRVNKIFPDTPENYRLKNTFFNVLSYIQKNDWSGACHASSAILFILLKEQGFEVDACIGEVSELPIFFDHSWVEINSQVIDAAISNTLVQGVNFPPVLLNYDLSSLDESTLNYGISNGSGLDAQAIMISQMSIGAYMDNFPGHPKGLWGVAKEIAKKQSLKLNIEAAKKKWGHCNWVVKS